MTTFSIGRSSENDIVLTDLAVSRQHAEIEPLGHGLWRLTDLDSTAGTFIRKDMSWEKISVVEVDGDDEVRFGEAPISEYSIEELIGKVENLQIEVEPEPLLDIIAAPPTAS